MKILFGGGHGSPLWSSPSNGSANRNRTSSWGGNSTSSNSSHGVGGGRGGKRRTTVRFYGGRDDSGPQDLIVTYFVVDNWLVELTDEERQNVWYSRQELDRFKMENDSTTKQQLGELCDDSTVILDLSKDWASRASALVGAELPEDQRHHHHRNGRRDIGKTGKSFTGNGKKKSPSSSFQQPPKSSSSSFTSKVFSGISNLSFSNDTMRKVPTQTRKGTQVGEKMTSSSLNGKHRQRMPVLGPAPVAPSENR